MDRNKRHNIEILIFFSLCIGNFTAYAINGFIQVASDQTSRIVNLVAGEVTPDGSVKIGAEIILITSRVGNSGIYTLLYVLVIILIDDTLIVKSVTITKFASLRYAFGITRFGIA